MKKYLFLFSALLLTACGTTDVNRMSDAQLESVISYETPEVPYILKLERNPLFFDQDKVIAQMKFNAAECGTMTTEGHFEALAAKYEDSVSVQYGFEYDGDNQGVSTFWVTVLPNISGYTSMDEFKADFNICNPNRGKFPYAVSKDWLMLVGSCGADYDDGSGNPYGCRVLREAVQPTLKFTSNEA